MVLEACAIKQRKKQTEGTSHFKCVVFSKLVPNKNLKYVLLNNNSHDSVGGQNTYANKVNFEKLSKSIGFKKFYCIKSRKNLEKTIISFLKNKKLSFLEVKISNNKIEKLPRPSNLVQIKKKFMK